MGSNKKESVICIQHKELQNVRNYIYMVIYEKLMGDLVRCIYTDKAAKLLFSASSFIGLKIWDCIGPGAQQLQILSGTS